MAPPAGLDELELLTDGGVKDRVVLEDVAANVDDLDEFAVAEWPR